MGFELFPSHPVMPEIDLTLTSTAIWCINVTPSGHQSTEASSGDAVTRQRPLGRLGVCANLLVYKPGARGLIDSLWSRKRLRGWERFQCSSYIPSRWGAHKTHAVITDAKIASAAGRADQAGWWPLVCTLGWHRLTRGAPSSGKYGGGDAARAGRNLRQKKPRADAAAHPRAGRAG